jgi:hypothetical protein
MLEVSRRRAQPIKSFFTSPTRKPALQMQGSAQGQKPTWACSDGSSVFSPTTDIETASDGRAEADDERQAASRESS